MLARYLSHIFRRYMCKNAPYNGLSKGISGTIFKFDELAAALDARLEAQVFAHIRELTAGRFAVLISHRLRTARMVDQNAVSNAVSTVTAGWPCLSAPSSCGQLHY
jgi:VIT1/CCC1 family predicted Fe2+/Mn2+ transporter